MKSKLLWVLFVLSNALAGFTQTAPLLTQLTQPYAVPTGVDEMALLNDLQGGFYVVYTEAGRFHVLRGAGDGQLVPYEVDFYGKTITNIHSLTTNPMGPGQFGCFVGTENGAERLYFFGIGASQKFAFYRNPFDNEAASGAIRRVEILARDLFIADVYYLKGDVLFATRSPFYPDGEPERERVSQADQRVGDYGAVKTWKDSTIVDFGWYIAKKASGATELSVFRKALQGAVMRENVGMVSEIAKMSIVEGVLADPHYVILDGDTVRLASFTDAGIVEELAFTAPGSTRTFFELGGDTPASGIVVCATETGERAYLVSGLSYQTPDFLPLSPSTTLEVVDILPMDMSRFLVIYRTSEGYYSAEVDLTMPASAIVHLVAGSDIVLVPYGDSLGVPHVIEFGVDKSFEVVMQKYENGSWGELQKLPENAATYISLRGLLRVETLFPIILGNKTFVTILSLSTGALYVEDHQTRVSYLTYENYAWNQRNGLYIVTALHEGTITLYGLGEQE